MTAENVQIIQNKGVESAFFAKENEHSSAIMPSGSTLAQGLVRPLFSRRIGRTYPGPPPEMEGLDQ